MDTKNGLIKTDTLSRSTIYDLMGKGQFPRPVKLTGKAVGWPESAISDWLNSRSTTA